jgi:hypothetical protein
MNDKFMISIFNIIEHITESELTNTSKQLITSYLKDSKYIKNADKARGAIERYTQTQIPDLVSIKQKADKQMLDAIDHLVLKMEYEARKTDEFEENS